MKWTWGLLIAFAVHAVCADRKPAPPPPAKKESTAPKPPDKTPAATNVPIYKPPRRGAPLVRIDGGSRNLQSGQPMLYVLAPEHAGLTSKEQPSLYWYLSGASRTNKLELTWNVERSRETLLSVSVNEPSSGFHQLDLAKHNITLQPGMAYRFSIALVIDPENRSRDVFASGVIIRTNLAPSLEQKLHPAIHEERPFFCAEAGLWYDALESLANLIAAQPANPHFLEQRDALLNQVGLTNVVRCEANLVAKPSE